MVETLSFLDLPLTIRFKVYSYVGLIRPCHIDLSAPKRSELGVDSNIQHECWLRGQIERQFEGGNVHGYSLSCFCPELPTALLRVSKVVFKEALYILVSRNKFVLRGRAESDFKILQMMKSSTLSSMTSLLLHLNCWPCLFGHSFQFLSSLGCRACGALEAESDPVLSNVSEEGQELMRQWKATCTHLSNSISPGELGLTLICDVADLRTAKEVISPLLSLPTLRQCTIRLGRLRNQELSTLARETSLRLTNAYTSKLAFSWERLPQELRLQILCSTHLASPGSYHRDFKVITIQDGKIGEQKQFSGFEPCCWKCTDTFADCCCPNPYSAYSASCVCRQFPFALFSVNRQMHKDAFKIFYSKNFFEFRSDPEKTLSFLQKLPSDAWGYFRRIRFLFNETDLQEWNDRHYTQKWKKLIHFIRGNMSVSKLSIDIDTSVGAQDLCLFVEDPESIRFLFNIYCDIGDSLKILPDLGDLFFDSGWFLELGPLLAKVVLGDRYKERPKDSTTVHYLQRQWEAPISWYERLGIQSTSIRDSSSWERKGPSRGGFSSRGRGGSS